MITEAISPLRQRMLDDMSMRRFVPDTQREYIRAVRRLATFLGRSPDSATPEELRAFQLHLTETGVQPPTFNATVTALRVLLQGDARPAGDDTTSCVRLRAAQAATRALAHSERDSNLALPHDRPMTWLRCWVPGQRNLFSTLA